MSHRDDILDAVEAHVRAALPSATVRRRRLLPLTIPNGGFVNIMLEAERCQPAAAPDETGRIALRRELTLGIHIVLRGAADALETALDDAAEAVEARLAADPALGGACSLSHVSALRPDFPGPNDPQPEQPLGAYRLTLAAMLTTES